MISDTGKIYLLNQIEKHRQRHNLSFRKAALDFQKNCDPELIRAALNGSFRENHIVSEMTLNRWRKKYARLPDIPPR